MITDYGGVNRVSGHTNRAGGEITSAVKAAWRGQLPPRYDSPIRADFRAAIESALTPGVRLLDVGSGRHPTILPEDRPPGTYYVGLDVSEAELSKAPEGSYDDAVVSDVAHLIQSLNGQFDLIVTWFVLEHVKPLDDAFEYMRTYLRPGGRLIAVTAGTFAPFALLNRAIPQPIGQWILKRLFGRPPESTFPAHYHHCW